MKALKFSLISLLVLGCSGDPITPNTGNEPGNYPTSFLAAVQSNTSILVSWEDVADATNYLVQAKTGSGTFVTVTDGTLVANDSDWSDNNAAAIVGKSIKQVNFTGLSAGTAYDFIIHPYNVGGTPEPDYKNDAMAPTANATTTDVVVVEPTSHATGFTATALSNTSINVSWVDAIGVDKYVVLAKNEAGSFATVSDGSLVTDDTDWANNNAAKNVNQTVQQVIFSGLVKNTSYDFTIYPYNEGGDPDPIYKIDGTVPSATTTTQNNASVTFDELLVTETTLTVSGSPFDITSDAIAYMSHPQKFINWSYIPRIIMAPYDAGNYAIGWYDESSSSIKITSVNSDDTKNGNDISVGSGVHAIGGFDLKGSDYVIGYVTGASKEVYNVDILSSGGVVNSTTKLTGTIGLEELNSKQAPLDFGSSRIKVNSNTSKIGVFLSHKMKWDDGVKHQAAMVKFLDYSGTILGGAVEPNAEDAAGGDGWFYSHNFDTRMSVNGDMFTLIGNGDAFPRAIPIRLINSSTGSYTENTALFPISGTLGDNDTKTQLGGFVLLDDGSHVLTFSSEEGRSTRDVSFIHIASDGSQITQKWLTNYTSKDVGYAVNVKSAKYGTNILLAWEEVTDDPSTTFKAMFAVVDVDGNIIEAPQQFSNIRFNRGDDFINFANGDVGWAIGSGSQLKVYRLKLVDLGG